MPRYEIRWIKSESVYTAPVPYVYDTLLKSTIELIDVLEIGVKELKLRGIK